jgi:hypothetical protein
MPISKLVEIERIDIIIADAERCVERQRDLMARLSALDETTEEAKLTLGLMLGTLEYLRYLRLNLHNLLPGKSGGTTKQ